MNRAGRRRSARGDGRGHLGGGADIQEWNATLALDGDDRANMRPTQAIGQRANDHPAEQGRRGVAHAGRQSGSLAVQTAIA